MTGPTELPPPDAPIAMRPIGRIHSPHTQLDGMPIQTAGAPQAPVQLEVFAEFAPGLRDIEGFEFLILLTHLHACRNERLEVVPFLDTQPHGIFATRAPARPNRIGLSIVQLESVDGCRLHLRGNDMLDGTPVLDIKPYVPAFDARVTQRIGWFGPRLPALAATRSDGRMR